VIAVIAARRELPRRLERALGPVGTSHGGDGQQRPPHLRGPVHQPRRQLGFHHRKALQVLRSPTFAALPQRIGLMLGQLADPHLNRLGRQPPLEPDRDRP
jgi:hypothetical protein